MTYRSIWGPNAPSDKSTVAEQHQMTVKAAVTTTEEGTFTAYASAYGNVDRMGERVIKGAFAETIGRWQAAGRDLPLVWDHNVGAHDVIGSVSSASMEERDAGLYVEGTLDIEDSELAREAWRSVKKNRISLSFGYLVEEDREAPDGVKELTKIDLMEVTLTAVPANPDARVLSAKSIDEQRYELPDGQIVDYETMVTEGPKVAAQRARARKAARPIQVARFKC